jgi:hypothetical protein
MSKVFNVTGGVFFVSTPPMPPTREVLHWWEALAQPTPQWWDDVCSDGTKLFYVEVKEGAVTIDNGTSTTHYKTFSAVPKWVQDKVLKLSMMPEMHVPIVGLGRRCRNGRYRVLVPAHMLSRSGPKPRKKWGHAARQSRA